MAAWARRSLAAVILYRRPPRRPRAHAEARSTLVRSMISSRSNSASAAKTPNISRPAEHQSAVRGGGVDGRPLASEHAQPHAAPGQLVREIDEVPQVAPKP